MIYNRKGKIMGIEENKKLRKIKIIFILQVILVILPINVALMAGGYYLFEKEQERIKYMGYTEYDLNKLQMDYLIGLYDIYIPEYKNAPMTFFTDNMYNPDKDKYKFVKGESCEEQIEKINSLLFNDNDGRYECTRESVLKYGFNENNPITSDWVMKHPYDALNMLMVLPADEPGVYDAVAEYDRYGIEFFWSEYASVFSYD